MKNKHCGKASQSELKKLMFRMKKVYALWMIENVVNDSPWCVGIPHYINFTWSDLRKLYPTMECWGLKDVDRWVKLEKGVILLKITSWKSRNKELRNKKIPHYVSGVMTEKTYIIFAFNEDKVVTRSVYVDLDFMPHTLSQEMVSELEFLKKEMDDYEMEPEDLFTDEECTDVNLN